jgi:tetratricopeptide (TPR) repeat protein
MSNFLSNKYKETLASCRDYLAKFPDGRYAGDMRYRLSFIDFNDKEDDQSEKIIRDLSNFLKDHPDDASNGSMLCLMADTCKRMENENDALDAYIKAVWTDSPDDVLQYALDSATTILQGRKDWNAIAQLHGDFLKRKPDSQLALLSATWVAKMKAREGKGAEAAELLANALKARIANPSSEQVEFLIDELVKTLVPRKKPKDIDVEAVDKELVSILEKIVAGQENATTAARIYYARARLAQLLRRNDRSDLYLKGIATTNAKDPSGLSPALLAVSGEILLKNGDLDGAEAMFKRLSDRYRDSMFSDAGPVGMGFIALARKQPEEALRIFNDALENNPGMSRFKETTLGKLEALVTLAKYDEASKLALQMVGDKLFRGETAGKAYLLLGQVYRKQSSTASGTDSTELLKKAHGTYQRVYVAYQGFPDVCAEGYWQAYETAKELGEEKLAEDTLKALKEHPKLQNTAQCKKAATMVN